MPLLVDSSGNLVDVSQEEYDRRKAGYAAIASDVAGRGGDGGVSLLRGGTGGTGVNLMGSTPMPNIPTASAAPVLTEDERVAKRAAEVEKQLAALPAREEPAQAPGMPAAPAGPPGAPPLPVPTTGSGRHVEGGVTTETRTRTKIDKQELAGQEAEARTIEKEKEIAGREAPLLERKAGVEEAAALVDARAAELQAEKEREKTEQFNALIKGDEDKYNAAVAERSKMKLRAFGEGDPVWKTAGRTIAVALGEIGRALTKGSQNTAWDIVQAQTDEHYRLERMRIEEADKKVATARQVVGDRKQSKQEALVDLEREHAAWNKALATRTRAESAAIGTEHAKLEGEKIANALDQKAAEHAQRVGALRREQVQTEGRTSWTNTTGDGAGAGRGGQPTENQAKLALLAQQMQGELDTISKNAPLTSKVLGKLQSQALGSEAADRAAAAGLTGAAGVAVARALGIVPKSKYEGMTDQEQLVANAWDNAVEKYARVLTGAGMPIDEARRLALQDAPHAGDSPVVIAQKFRRMQSFAAQAMSLSGRAGQQIAPAAPGAGGAPAGLNDEQAIQLARQRLQANPNDEKAKQVLRMHGVQ